MSDIINVTIVGHSSAGLNALEQVLQDDLGIDLTRKLLLQNTADPFVDLPHSSNVLILDLSDNWRDVLAAVASRTHRNRTPIILVGPDDDTEMMKLALRAGARDFQSRPLSAADLRQSVHALANEQPNGSSGNAADVSVFLSAKGGAGTSAIVTSLGHVLARRKDNERVLLMDLDLQYGNLPLYFDQSSTTKLTQALIASERMDNTLLDACLITTEEGIDLLASHSDQVFSPWDIQQRNVTNLLNLACDRYDHILIDVPRQIDPITFQAIEMSSRVSIVMQQTLCDLRHARQIISLLRDQGLPNERLRILVNRHDKRNVLRINDISDAFDGLNVTTLPNDYKRVSSTMDNAVSLTGKYSGASISKGLLDLAATLFPLPEESRQGFLGRWLSS